MKMGEVERKETKEMKPVMKKNEEKEDRWSLIGGEEDDGRLME